MSTSRVHPGLLALILVASCLSPTGPTVSNVTAHQQTWNAQGLADYTFDYTIGLGFFNQFAGRPMRLQVSHGVVVSGLFIATGDPLPGDASQFPTIDTLFARAVTLLRSGNLKRIEFDSQLGYPLSIEIAGPPDASGTLTAANVQRLH